VINSKTELIRKLGLFSVTNIVIANMIGTGIFTTSGLLMEELSHPLLMILLWSVGGVIAICGTLSYGELGASIPKAGGEYVFLTKLYHPVFGFLSGWVSFIVGFSAPVAASSIAFSEYLIRAFPQILVLGHGFSPVIIKKFFSITVIVSFTLFHVRGLKFGSIIQNILTILKIGLICGLIIAGFSWGRGHIYYVFESVSFNFDFKGWKTIGLSLMWIMFAYSGWNASTYIGSEIKNPKKNLPLSLFMGTGIVMFLYICLNVLYIYAIPAAKMKGVISIGGLVAGSLFGNFLDSTFSFFISIALLSSISAFIILGPRIYFAMAKNGHFFKFAAEIDYVHRIPKKSILIQGIISSMMVLTGSFDQILTFMGFALGIFPILTVAGVFKLRIMRENRIRLPGYPWIQIFYIFISILILILAFFERPVESSIAILIVIAGIPLFFIFLRKSVNKKNTETRE
jgi:APA family basic amino acid/polyamine antiporter